jgi:hypothetical protein
VHSPECISSRTDLFVHPQNIWFERSNGTLHRHQILSIDSTCSRIGLHQDQVILPPEAWLASLFFVMLPTQDGLLQSLESDSFRIVPDDFGMDCNKKSHSDDAVRWDQMRCMAEVVFSKSPHHGSIPCLPADMWNRNNKHVLWSKAP